MMRPGAAAGAALAAVLGGAGGRAEAAAAAGTGPDLRATLASLLTTHALAEAAILLGCLGLAALLTWLLARAWRRTSTLSTPSILFGERVVDGVLFPTLALLGARRVRGQLRAILPITVFDVAVPILLSLVVIRITVRVLHAAFPRSGAVRVLERTVSWLVWIGLVLWLTGLLPVMLAEMESMRWKLGGAEVSLRSLVEGALSAAAVLVLALWAAAAIETRLMAGVSHGGDDLSMRKIAANAARALLLLISLLLALSAAGIPIGALGVLGGALGVGIGFGLQKLAANYVSGFVILAERSLRIGDMVRVDGFEGRISDIHTRYTVIRALNGRESIVPNEMLITSRVENDSLADPRLMNTTPVTVGYDTDVETLRPLLVAAVAQVPRVLSEPGPGVALTGFGADGLELNIVFWIADPHNGVGNVRSDVNLAVLRLLREQGVEIPYPQRIVQVRRTAATSTAAPTPAPPAPSPG